MRPHLGIDVAAPSELAWEQLVVLDHWPAWGPTVSGARLDDGTRRLGPGATGAVRTPVGVWLPFAVEHWQDAAPERSWSWRVAGVPATSHSVLDRGRSGCRVEMSVPLAAVGYLGVVRVALARIKRRAERAAA